MDYLLKKIFPPLNEMTVFIFTVTLYSLSLYVDTWPNPIEIIVSTWAFLIKISFSNIKGLWDIVIGLFMLVIATVIIVSVIVVPLLLPYAKKKYDLRFFCLFVIYADAVIAFASNIMSLISNLQTIYIVLSIYSFAWILYLSHISKFSRKHVEPMDFIMDDTQATAIYASVAAGISIFVVYCLIKIFSIEWYHAYTTGTIACSTVMPVVQKAANTVWGRSN